MLPERVLRKMGQIRRDSHYVTKKQKNFMYDRQTISLDDCEDFVYTMYQSERMNLAYFWGTFENMFRLAENISQCKGHLYKYIGALYFFTPMHYKICFKMTENLYRRISGIFLPHRMQICIWSRCMEPVSGGGT